MEWRIWIIWLIIPDIPDYFEYTSKKHGGKTVSPPIKMY